MPKDAALALDYVARYTHKVAIGDNRIKAILAAIRAALHVEPPPASAKDPLAERILRQTGVDITLCPHCGQGHLRKTDRQIVPQRGQSP